MFKGIYNVGEYYTNFYFESKLKTDLLSKKSNLKNIENGVKQLSNLDSLYWAFRDEKKKNSESLRDFYSKVILSLSLPNQTENNVTLDEKNITSFSKNSIKNIDEFYFFLTNEYEQGDFESIPLVGQLSDGEIAEDRDLSSIITEYFDELENPPKWIMIGAPTTMFLIERNKWSRGQYLKFNWDEIFQQKNEEIYTCLYILLSSESLYPESGSSLHTEIDDNSHRQAFEVTTELRESVRESIELLINELIHLRKEAKEAYHNKGEADVYAKELSHDALFYVYRLIFLLYLESQGEDSDLLPLKSEIYRHGYSLEKLLELIHDLPDEKTEDYEGSFVHESLDQIFSLIYNGFDYETINKSLNRNQFSGQGDFLNDSLISLVKNDTSNVLETTDGISNTGFLLKGIKSDLFNPDSIKHLKGKELRNGVLLRILKKLSLSEIGKGKNKRVTRVSYSNLGINQLGAVYEGLLSYSGFFAEEDLHALKPASVKQSDLDNGKEQDQIYLAPKSLVEKYSNTKEKKYKLTAENNVLGDDGHPKIYKKGSFIYRLAGRDRQKLASYYTPESLTKCTVKYSLKVLFENKKTLEELWDVKILEPAMGSGAFLNEAVNQLSDKILEMEVHQKFGELKTPKDKQKRLWEVKYQLISNNVYGLDLNPTAIELARFSLWLNCIGAGKEPPNFDGRLKVGNSLIGARFKKGDDGIFPWLLLDDGMMNYGKRLKDYDAEQFEKIQIFRKKLIASRLESSNNKIKALQLHAEIFLKELVTSKDKVKKVTCYERLKLCGDIWCSFFFLTGEDLKHYPQKHEELLDVFASILEKGTIDQKLKSIVESKYTSERFFHWEIEFPEIIAQGGFDLILGNPPWVAITWQEKLFISDLNLIPSVKNLNAAESRDFISNIQDGNVTNFLFNEYISLSGYSILLEVVDYNILKGVQKNTYKAFMVKALELVSENGAIGFIHEDGLLEEDNAEKIRMILYQRFAYHFQFQNELLLFSEVHDAKRYSLNILRGKMASENVTFVHIGNLFHPSTIESCFNSIFNNQDVPGIKNSQNKWETQGHPERIINISKKELECFSQLKNIKSTSPPFLNVHSQGLLRVLEKISNSGVHFKDYVGTGSFIGTTMLHETGAQDDNVIQKGPFDNSNIDGMVLSGPNIEAFNLFSQEARQNYTSNQSYDSINLTEVEEEFLPRTLYKLKIDTKKLDEKLAQSALNSKPYRSYYRLMTRTMVNPANERSLFTAIAPPLINHINGIASMAISDRIKLAICSGFAASLIADAIQRFKSVTNFFPEDFEGIPIGLHDEFHNSIARRSLYLNCISTHFNDLWKATASLSSDDDKMLDGKRLNELGKVWNPKFPLRSKVQRDSAIIEIDTLVALSFGIDEDELIQVYEIMFPVLRQYDQKSGVDRKEKFRKSFKYFKERGW